MYDCAPGLHRGTVRSIARIEGPLGLSSAELGRLRDRYWAENGRFPSLHLIALLTGLVAVMAMAARRRPSMSRNFLQVNDV